MYTRINNPASMAARYYIRHVVPWELRSRKEVKDFPISNEVRIQHAPEIKISIGQV